MKTLHDNSKSECVTECPVVKSLEKKTEAQTNACGTYVSVTPCMSMSDLEKLHIMNALAFFKGNKTKTAKSLGVSLKTLYNKLDSYSIVTATFGESKKLLNAPA